MRTHIPNAFTDAGWRIFPEFLGDVLRGMESGVFLVEGKERTDNADVPE
jgi:hypothetical protein